MNQLSGRAWMIGSATALLLAGCEKPTHPSSEDTTTFVSEAPTSPDDARSRTLGELGRSVEARFGNITDPIDRAAAEMKAGYVPVAIDVMDMMTTAQKTDPRYASLYAKAQALNNSEQAADQVEGIGYKIKTYWRPQLQQEPTTEPETVEEIWKREQFFELMAGYLDDDRITDGDGNDVPMPKSAQMEWNRFRAELSARQVKMYPILRRAYAKLIGQRVWSNDVYVRATGRTITFTGALFAANANIQQAEDTVQQDLRKLRFVRSDYEWCKGCGGGSHYDLTSPSDAVIARWNDNQYEPLK
jgi:hypothetical protein